jgi:hypothetical protein
MLIQTATEALKFKPHKTMLAHCVGSKINPATTTVAEGHKTHNIILIFLGSTRMAIEIKFKIYYFFVHRNFHLMQVVYAQVAVFPNFPILIFLPRSTFLLYNIFPNLLSLSWSQY